MEAAAGLISDKDLIMTAGALHLSVTLLQHHPSTAAQVSTKMLHPAIFLAQSPLLQACRLSFKLHQFSIDSVVELSMGATQGSALEALQAFFIALLQSGAGNATFEALLGGLLSAGNSSETSKSAQMATAQCIAKLCTAAGPRQTASTVGSLLDSLQVSV